MTPRRPSRRKATAPKSGEPIVVEHLRQLQWRAELTIFAVALIVRLIYFSDSIDSPTFAHPIIDALSYDKLARAMVAGKPLTQEILWQPFFYPFFLHLVYSVTSGSLLAVKLIQVLLGAATSALTCRLGRRLADTRTGVVAGLIVAFYGPLIFFEGELLATAWAAFWSIALVSLFRWVDERPNTIRALALGLCAGIGIVTRPTFLLFLIAGGAWLVWRARRGEHSTKVAAVTATTIALGFAAVVTPVAMVSYVVTKNAPERQFRFLPESGPLNLFIGNNSDREATIAIRPGVEWERLMLAPGVETRGDQAAQGRYFKERVRRYALDQPLSFVGGLLGKSVEFVNSRELPRNVDIYMYREWSWLLSALVWRIGGFGFPFGVLGALAAVGLVARRKEWPVPIWLYLLFYPVAVIAVFVTARYRAPIVPVAAIPAAAGLLHVIAIAREKRVGEMAVTAVGAGALVVAMTLPGPFAAEMFDYEAEMYYCLADEAFHAKRYDESVEFFEKAIARRPDYASAHNNLGNALTARDDLDEAIVHYRSAIAADADHPHAHLNLAKRLSDLKRFDESVDAFKGAIRVDPRSPPTRISYGIALIRLNRHVDAIAQFEEAVRLNPRHATALCNLGGAFASIGKHEKAVERLEQALRLNPTFAEAHCNLGSSLQSLNRHKEALAHFREALRLKPDFPQANEGLAISLKRMEVTAPK